MRDLERSVCGCDYGSTSWTTRREAGRIAHLLELRPAEKLLDVGAESGWPGLYLAHLTGCDVVLVDLPLAALRTALECASADSLSQRCEVVAADGAALPFEDASFDALIHSDVLCCTPDKLAVLPGVSPRRARGRQYGVHGYRAHTLIGRLRASDRDRVRPAVC